MTEISKHDKYEVLIHSCHGAQLSAHRIWWKISV